MTSLGDLLMAHMKANKADCDESKVSDSSQDRGVDDNHKSTQRDNNNLPILLPKLEPGEGPQSRTSTISPTKDHPPPMPPSPPPLPESPSSQHDDGDSAGQANVFPERIVKNEIIGDDRSNASSTDDYVRELLDPEDRTRNVWHVVEGPKVSGSLEGEQLKQEENDNDNDNNNDHSRPDPMIGETAQANNSPINDKLDNSSNRCPEKPTTAHSDERESTKQLEGDDRDRDYSRERGHKHGRDKDKDQDRDRERNRDRDRVSRDRDHRRDRDRDHRRDRDRDHKRSRDRDHDRDRSRDHERGGRKRSREHDRDREHSRDRKRSHNYDRDTDRDRRREQPHSRERSRGSMSPSAMVQPSMLHHHHSSLSSHSSSRNLPPNSYRIYVGSLHVNLTEDMLRSVFEPFGKILRLEIMKDRITNISRGYGFITFANVEDGQNAVQQLDGLELGGKLIKVGKSMEKTDRSSSGYAD